MLDDHSLHAKTRRAKIEQQADLMRAGPQVVHQLRLMLGKERSHGLQLHHEPGIDQNEPT